MSVAPFLIFLLPLLATAKIQIDIQASDHYYNTKVHMSGTSEELISDRDRTIFQLRDWEVKDAVYALSGGRPDDVYLRGPTPWGNLYLTYNWNEVKRTIIPVKVKVLDISTDTVVVDIKSLSQSDMSVRHMWTAGSSYYFDDHVSYSISLGEGIGKYRSVYYKNWFGFEHTTASGVSIGSGLSVTPQSQRNSVATVITAKRSVLKVEVAYEASLDGGVACNYANKFNRHHFWNHDVNMCLEAAGKPRKLSMKEVIEVVIYYNEHFTSS